MLPFLLALQWPCMDPALHQAIHHQEPQRWIHTHTKIFHILVLHVFHSHYPSTSSSSMLLNISFTLIIIYVWRPPNYFFKPRTILCSTVTAFKDNKLFFKNKHSEYTFFTSPLLTPYFGAFAYMHRMRMCYYTACVRLTGLFIIFSYSSTT